MLYEVITKCANIAFAQQLVSVCCLTHVEMFKSSAEMRNSMKKRPWIRNCIMTLFVVTLLAGLTGCGKKESTIYLFAAASLTDAMTQITDAYQADNAEVTIILQTDSRITSYNVCYTKLLRIS